MTSDVLAVLGAMGVGACAMVVGQSVWRSVRKARIRCAWCGRVHVNATGQACVACLEAVAREGRAAPDDWPEA